MSDGLIELVMKYEAGYICFCIAEINGKKNAFIEEEI